MSAKIEKGGHGRIPYLLRCAFKAAEEGDRVEAMHYWNTAVEEGYRGKRKTHDQLLFRLREGESKASLDPEPVDIEAAPTMNRGGIAERIAERRIWRMNRGKPQI